MLPSPGRSAGIRPPLCSTGSAYRNTTNSKINGHPIEPNTSTRGQSNSGIGLPLNNDRLLEVLRTKIRDYVFRFVPVRVIKLPEMKLKERGEIADYIIENKLDNAVREIRKHIRDGIHAGDPYEMSLSDVVKDLTKFVILSHTWGEDEPSYEDFLHSGNVNKNGYKKLQALCWIAHVQYGAEFAWADTVCINKLSSSELDESIRSMFTWYRHSSMCIVYLAKSSSLLNMPFDRWFTRGWTLQELLAPLQIKFYNKDWQPITDLSNDKADPEGPDASDWLPKLQPNHVLQLALLGRGITEATSIPIRHVRAFRPGVQNPSFPERMKWIARRNTTRPEDKSYSMMGVLGISMPVAYGEGPERAFFRLFKEIIERGCEPGWFLWTGGQPIADEIHSSKMIPSSSECYSSWDPELNLEYRRSECKQLISLTNIGVSMTVLILPVNAKAVDSQHSFITCPLSDDTVKMVLDTPENPVFPSDRSQFALGVLGYRVIQYSFQKEHVGRVYGVLLRRSSPASMWERCGAGSILAFRLNEEFRTMDINHWFRAEIAQLVLGNSKYSEEDTPVVRYTCDSELLVTLDDGVYDWTGAMLGYPCVVR